MTGARQRYHPSRSSWIKSNTPYFQLTALLWHLFDLSLLGRLTELCSNIGSLQAHVCTKERSHLDLIAPRAQVNNAL